MQCVQMFCGPFLEAELIQTILVTSTYTDELAVTVLQKLMHDVNHDQSVRNIYRTHS